METGYRIVIAGDLLPWKNNSELFNNGNALSLFGERICSIFASSDFSIVNLEGPLTDSTERQNKIGPVIKAGKESINGLTALGIKAVALANNHVTDYLDRGVQDTISVVENAGIQYVGAGLCKDEVKTHLSFLLGEKRVCIYNVSEFFFNAPVENGAGVNLYDEYLVCNEIRELKKVHDYLIVIYHGGAEYFPYPTPQTRRRFHRMADSGADFISAQHTHCIGCEEDYNGSYLLYGQGNFLFSKQSTGKMTTEGLVIEILFLPYGVQISKHCVQLNSNACLEYAADQSLNEFYERSKVINDDEFIKEQFKRLKPDRIVDRYLLAYKGCGHKLRYIHRFLPKKIWRRILESYSTDDIMRILFTLTSDRANEDVVFLWHKLSDKCTESKRK